MGDIHIIDVVFIVLVVLMIVHGYIRGLIKELFSWAAIVAAVLTAVFLHPPVAELIRSALMPNVRYVPELLAFVIIFFIVVLICKVVEQILKNLITGARLGGLDKILGAVFGFIEGFAITALILFVLSVQPIFDVSQILTDSIFAQIFLPHFSRLPFDLGVDPLNIALLLTGIHSV